MIHTEKGPSFSINFHAHVYPEANLFYLLLRRSSSEHNDYVNGVLMRSCHVIGHWGQHSKGKRILLYIWKFSLVNNTWRWSAPFTMNCFLFSKEIIHFSDLHDTASNIPVSSWVIYINCRVVKAVFPRGCREHF